MGKNLFHPVSCLPFPHFAEGETDSPFSFFPFQLLPQKRGITISHFFLISLSFIPWRKLRLYGKGGGSPFALFLPPFPPWTTLGLERERKPGRSCFLILSLLSYLSVTWLGRREERGKEGLSIHSFTVFRYLFPSSSLSLSPSSFPLIRRWDEPLGWKKEGKGDISSFYLPFLPFLHSLDGIKGETKEGKRGGGTFFLFSFHLFSLSTFHSRGDTRRTFFRSETPVPRCWCT